MKYYHFVSNNSMDVFIHKKSKKKTVRAGIRNMEQQSQRTSINRFPYGEAHMHIFMNGTDYRKAVADQKDGVCDRVIHEHLAEYQKRGMTWLREGGDFYGT